MISYGRVFLSARTAGGNDYGLPRRLQTRGMACWGNGCGTNPGCHIPYDVGTGAMKTTNLFPRRNAITGNAGTRVSRFNGSYGTYQDKEIMQNLKGGGETKRKDETSSTLTPCTISL